MWLLNRRTFLLGAVALGGASACGFTPVYGPKGEARALLNAVAVDPPRDREGYLLVRHIEERLGRATAPTYGLSIAIKLDQERMAITDDNIAARFNLLGKATYALRDLSTGEVVTTGIVESFTGYSTTGSTAATQAASRNASERLMTILGDKVITRLMSAKLSSGT